MDATFPDYERVSFGCAQIAGVLTARKRHACDGHLRRERHFIEPGERYVASALPPDDPDIGNRGWRHGRFCQGCCPDEYAEQVLA